MQMAKKFSSRIEKTVGKEKLLISSNFSFSHNVFYPFIENFLPLSSDLKLSSAKSFSLEEPKICRLGKG